jgi:threonine synthase
VDLHTAVIQGLAPDGGLYLPERIEELPRSFFERAPNLSFPQIAHEMASALIGGDVPAEVLERIVRESFDFAVPLKPMGSGSFVLELFWGPTLAFKDFAARFMARLMSYFVAGANRELHILVATSGDTGSAVSHGFRSVPGIRVHVLFPSGRVSAIQEAQLTATGENVTALEVAGSFDDCQRLVKTAFVDDAVRERLWMSSANSINIARLIPQSFYYCWAWSRVPDRKVPVVISVPSGNFGNLTAGLLAKRMGLPVERFIAATNVNDAVPVFLETGIWKEHPVVATLSNAMDVSRPSNWERILELYSQDRSRLRADIAGFAFDDRMTRHAIQEIYHRFGYIPDPHGAVGWLGLEAFRATTREMIAGIFLETAHPCKFPDVIREELGISVEIPEQAREAMLGPRRSVRISPEYAEFRDYLMSLG